jgi:hypothetical protein
MRRNGHENLAARAQHPTHLSEGGSVVVEVFDDVKSSDEIEGAVLEWEGLSCAQLNIDQAALATVPHRLCIDVDALRLSIRGQVGQHRSSSAPHVEDPALVYMSAAYVPVQELQQDPPAADEPPVDILHLPVLAVVLSLQGLESCAGGKE